MSDRRRAIQHWAEAGVEGKAGEAGAHDAADELEWSEADESELLEYAVKAPSITRLGRYRLVREIASGGMASVNLAVAEGLDKLVALKVIHPHLAQEEGFVHMFLDEARIASSISHRNVCGVFDFGECEGRFYIAMDYLAGQSLRDLNVRLRKQPSLDSRRHAVYVAYILAEACEGLHAAHELVGIDGKPLRVVHRDVSPHNLFVTYDGNVSVVDFGIARAEDRLQHTATGVLKGKFSYMAPEQVRQREIDRRADVWALGVCLWESLTLTRLFARATQADTLMSVMVDPIRRPSELCPDIHPALDAIVARALERKPEQRYASAREFGRDLMRFCRDSGVAVGPIEIEQWMAGLFAQEIQRKEQLVRYARKESTGATHWLDLTPSSAPRTPTHSGTMLKLRLGAPPALGGLENAAAALSSSPPQKRAQLAEAARFAGLLRQRNQRVLAGAGLGLLAVFVAFAVWAGSDAPPAAPQPPQAASVAPNVAPQPAPAPQVAPAPAALPAPTPVVQELHPPPPSPERRPIRFARPLPRPRAVAAPAPQIPEAPPAAPQVAPAPPAPTPEVEPIAAAEVVAPPAPAAAPAPSAPARATVAPQAPVRTAALPPQALSANTAIEQLDVEGSLGTGVVGRMLTRAAPLMRSCYAEAAKRAGRNDFSSLSLSLVIDEAGHVQQVEAGAHPLAGFAGCVGGALRRSRSDIKPDVGTVRVRFQVGLRP